MKLIVLAAGKGTRLYPLTKNRPKMLIELEDGITLLDKQMELLARSNVVDEVIYIVGYFGARVEQRLRELADKYKIKAGSIYNPFYNHSNNLASLWLARDRIGSNVCITNGDNLFSPDVFRNIDAITKEGIFLTTAVKEEYDDDDMKVIKDDRGMLQAIGKDIPVEEANAESVGLVKIQGDMFVKRFKDILDELMRDENKLNSFWLESFNHLHSTGVPINTFQIDGENKWQEIDFHLDLKHARAMVADRVHHLTTD